MMTLKILQRTFLCISVKCAPERFEDNWFLSPVPSFTENFKMARDVLCSTVLEVSTMQYSKPEGPYKKNTYLRIMRILVA